MAACDKMMTLQIKFQEHLEWKLINQSQFCQDINWISFMVYYWQCDNIGLANGMVVNSWLAIIYQSSEPMKTEFIGEYIHHPAKKGQWSLFHHGFNIRKNNKKTISSVELFEFCFSISIGYSPLPF